ncbi:MAG: hypothetical protein ACRDBX_00485 [Erysipelotrichaceae bacterium]
MALMECKVCGKQRSDRALQCPHCKDEGMVKPTQSDNLLCEECGASFEKDLHACPQCGFPVEEGLSVETIMETPIEVAPSKKKKMDPKMLVAIGILVFALVGVAFGFGSNKGLSGDDKIAYEIVKNVVYKFKDPASVKFVSGSLGLDKDILWCGLSATNGFGATVTQYYAIFDDGYVLEEDNPGPLHMETTELNSKAINKQLKKDFAE